MSWFGGSKPAPPPPPPASSYESDPFESYAPPPPSASSYGGGGLSGQDGLEQALMIEQQRAAVTAAIAKLTELCFTKCIARPDAKLSSSEQQCIINTADRYLDASMYVMGRLTRQGGGQHE